MAGTYIELVGVAGAGKTSTANILVDEARKRRIVIRTRDVVGKNFLLRVKTIYNIATIVLLVPEVLSLYLVRTRRAYAHTPHVRGRVGCVHKLCVYAQDKGKELLAPTIRSSQCCR